jgi:hypothetical protein
MSAASAFTVNTERLLVALGLFYAIADMAGVGGLVYNLGISVLGLVSVHADQVKGLQLTFWATCLGFLAGACPSHPLSPSHS